VVFKLCCKIGIPIRGLLHDLSKYSPTEFCESVKYYNGKKSPIVVCKEKNTYSKAWLHHKGRNKHHSEYWVDFSILPKLPIIPYKYTAEMICDRLAASIVYNGKDFNNNMPLEYWNKEKEILMMNDKIKNLLTHVLTEVSKNGINKTLTKKNIKTWYNKYCA
jgi:hypothetical protein